MLTGLHFVGAGRSGLFAEPDNFVWKNGSFIISNFGHKIFKDVSALAKNLAPVWLISLFAILRATALTKARLKSYDEYASTKWAKNGVFGHFLSA